jgi:uncharacterized protein
MIGRLTEIQILDVLKNNFLGRIGCNDGAKTYVVPINYIYYEGYIIGHSVAGMKIEMMRKKPQVCFEVDEMQSFTNWKSVIAWGKYEELNNEDEKQTAMKLFVDGMMHMKISETAVLPQLTERRVHPRTPGVIKPIVYKIVFTEKTGRYEMDEKSTT